MQFASAEDAWRAPFGGLADGARSALVGRRAAPRPAPSNRLLKTLEQQVVFGHLLSPGNTCWRFRVVFWNFYRTKVCQRVLDRCLGAEDLSIRREHIRNFYAKLNRSSMCQQLGET